MYKASEEFLHSLVSHRGVPTVEAVEAVALAALPANPKEKSQNYSIEPKLFKRAKTIQKLFMISICGT